MHLPRRLAVPLTTQLLLLLAVAILLPLALMLDRIRTDALDAEQRAATRAGWVARRGAVSVGNSYQVAIGAADGIAYLDGYWNGSDADRDWLLSTLDSAYPALQGLVHLGLDLEQHGSSSQATVGADWRSAALAAAQADKPVFANEAAVTTDAGVTALPIVVPIHEGNAPHRQGFLGIMLQIEPLSAAPAGTPPADERLLLVDGQTGRSVGLTSASVGPDPSPTLPQIENILSGPRVFHTSDASGHDQVAAWELVPGTPWIVLVYLPAETLLSPIRTLAAQQALVALGMTSILSTLLFVFWRRLQQSVGDLQALAVDNANLQAALVQRGHQLEVLVARLFSAQEEERRHVAIDVHDGVAQTAAATHQRLESLAAVYRPRSPQTRRDLQRARELARRTVQEARRIIAGLRPAVLDDFGLAAALQQLAEQLRVDGLEVTAEVSMRPGSERLTPMVETALYRVAQEAVANIRKHAGADRARLTLQDAGGVVQLTIADNGRGFDPYVVAPGGAHGERVGIDGMHERLTLLGGRLVVESQPGGGTCVVAELAVPKSTRTCQVAGLVAVDADRSLAITRVITPAVTR